MRKVRLLGVRWQPNAIDRIAVLRFSPCRARALFIILWACIAPPALAEDEITVQLFPAVGDTRGFIVEGRVVERRTAREVKANDPWWTNLWRNLRHLIIDEQPHVALTIRAGNQTWIESTDAEGYFQVHAQTSLAEGWHPVTAHTNDKETTTNGTLLIVPRSNRLGIISDLDDTLLLSNVNDKSELLGNSLLKNPQQRSAVPGAAAFLARTLARNPRPDLSAMIYLSASPRQLSDPIETFLTLNKFPPGVLITKKVTNDSTGEPLTNQVAYKSAKIEAIFARLPHVNFILLGDDGEKDPEIYQALRARHPGRVLSVWIRRVHPDPQRVRFSGQENLNEALGRFAPMPIDR